MSLAGRLRGELAERARRYAEARGLRCCVSYGDAPAVCFVEEGAGHGNFAAASYRAIRGNREWQRRLLKVHTTARRSLPGKDEGRWRELDSCMSSDALLMNVFCYPRVLRRRTVAELLGVEPGAEPDFGSLARVPLANGRTDRTEVDLRVGDLLVEAKLTESDFQRAPKKRMLRYRDFREVFEEDLLPQREEVYESYQLLRNVLAAHASGRALCVLVDARRGDLMEAWYRVMRSVKPVELKTRCKALTWQELAETLPGKLREFLGEKYGIAG